MIKMTIYNGEEVQQRDLPCDFLSLRMSLYQMNLMRHPDEVSVRDVQVPAVLQRLPGDPAAL